MANTYTLRELADSTDVSPRTVRYYIAEGLMEGPDRKGGPDAVYTDNHVTRIAYIKAKKDEGLTLDQIKAALTAPPVAVLNPMPSWNWPGVIFGTNGGLPGIGINGGLPNVQSYTTTENHSGISTLERVVAPDVTCHLVLQTPMSDERHQEIMDALEIFSNSVKDQEK